MQPRTRSYDDLLASSPLLNGNVDSIRAMFHVEHLRRDLEALAAELAAATRANHDAAKAWENLGRFKATILALLRTGLNVP